MRKSIYDILGKKINVLNEYERLYDLFINEYTYSYGSRKYSLADLFDIFIEDWEYRSTYRNIEEILLDLELEEETTEDAAMQDILYLIELILNIDCFIERKNAIFNKQHFDYGDRNVELICKKSNIIMENIEILLRHMGYKSYKQNKNQIKIRKNNADALETATIVEDGNIADLILDYTDFRIENDLKAKKDILNGLGQYIEPFRKEIRNANSNLEDYIFFSLNKLNIRHNNKSGKEKTYYVTKMKKKDLINWYDKVYDLILIAIRLVEMPNYFKDFKELKKKIIEEEKTEE